MAMWVICKECGKKEIISKDKPIGEWGFEDNKLCKCTTQTVDSRKLEVGK